MKWMAAAALVAALCLAVTGTAAGRTSSYTCTYKMPGFPIYATLYGSDNSPAFCSIYSRSAGESRWYGAVGRTRCEYSLNSLDVTMRISSPSSTWGPLACVLIKTPRGWTRTR